MRKESSAEATKGAPVPPIGGTDCAANTLQEREGRDAFGSGIDRIDGWVAWVNNWSDLAGDEGWGEAWGWRAGKGGDGGGAPESSVGATKGALVPPFGSLKNLTTSLILLVTRVGGWGEAW